MPKFEDLPAEVLDIIGCNLDQCSILSLVRTAKYLGMLEPLLYRKVYLSSNKGIQLFYSAIKPKENGCRASLVQSLKIAYRNRRMSLNRIVALMKWLPNLQNVELVQSNVQGVFDSSFISRPTNSRRFAESVPNLRTVSIDTIPDNDWKHWHEGLLKLMEPPSLKVYKIRCCSQSGELYQTSDVPLEFMEISNISQDPSSFLFNCRPVKRLLLCAGFDKPNLEDVVSNVTNSNKTTRLESLFIDTGPVAPKTDFSPYTYLSFKPFTLLKKLGLRWASVCQAIFPTKESYEASRLDIFPQALQCLWLHFDDETDEDFNFAAARFSTFFLEMARRKNAVAPRLEEVLYWMGRRKGRGELLNHLSLLESHITNMKLREQPQTFARRLTFKTDRLRDFNLENYRAEPVDTLVY